MIVDDIIDSGRTRDQWRERFPEKPFVALVDKTGPDKDLGWVVFPWEMGVEDGAESNVVRILQAIGEDPEREGLQETPRRVMKAWREMTTGYQQDPEAILKTGFDSDGYDQMIVCKNVEFYSVCEHHMLPFYGLASVAYIPNRERGGIRGRHQAVHPRGRRATGHRVSHR